MVRSETDRLRGGRPISVAAASMALLAALCLGPMAPGAQARSSTPGTAKNFEGVSTVSWGGMEIRIWNIPGRGVYAYKIVAPEDLATGWRYCEAPDGYRTTMDECLGARRRPGR